MSIENNGDNSYGVIWNGHVETWNAYAATQTNDLDRNGRDEIWIMGQAFYNGIPKIRITLFEANGNDSYHAVGRIDLIGVFSFGAWNVQSLDVDKDGKEEVMICIDANVIILKFAGSENHQKYEVFYIKQNWIPGITYYGATMYDLDNDDEEEIIISMQNYPNTGHRLLSAIYKPDSTTDVIQEISEIPENFLLYQNYPNPFNPSTIISYQTPTDNFVTLKVFDVLGREVAEIVNTYKEAGIHSVEFNASYLPSGMYLYRIQIGNYIETRKLILQK